MLALAAIVLATPAFGIFFLVDQTETEVHELREAKSDTDQPDQTTLYFVDAPHHFVTLRSSELRKWLDEREQSTVRATFSVTRDFGSARAISLEDIEGWDGDATRITESIGQGCGEERGLGPCSNEDRPSPWD